MDDAAKNISSDPQQQIHATQGSSVHDVVQAIVTGSVQGDLHIGNTILTRSNLEEFKEFLARAVATYEAQISQTVLREPLSSMPYKFLRSFTIEDASIFFGRESAIEEFCKRVLQDRFTVLHAKSGGGKSSLLQAGLFPRLVRQGYLPLSINLYHDPIEAIKRSIIPAHLGPLPNLFHLLSLHEFLSLVYAHLSRQMQGLVVVLDQFEDFFRLKTHAEERVSFIRALGTCYDDRSLPVRFIIALRKDYYSDLADFDQALPHLNIFRNQYRLEGMTSEEAQRAIVQPLSKLGLSLSYDPGLLEVLLADLAQNEIELPLLQIVCTRLYETKDDEQVLTTEMYNHLGRTAGVLGSYLHDSLVALPSRGEKLARMLLKDFIRVDTMKALLSYPQLQRQFGVQKDDLDRVLAHLVEARLLYRDEVDGEIYYQLTHEYLATEIKKWLSAEDIELKKTEELLKRELTNWHVHQVLIPRYILEILHVYVKRFRDLTASEWQCLILSALEVDFAVADWAEAAGDFGEKILFEVFHKVSTETHLRIIRALGDFAAHQRTEFLMNIAREDENFQMRREAVNSLKRIADPATVPFLSAIALEDQHGGVRRVAVEALSQMNDPTVNQLFTTIALNDEDGAVIGSATDALCKINDPTVIQTLITALKDEDGRKRGQAACALGKIGNFVATQQLIIALRDKDKYVRWNAACALGAIGDTVAVQPLIATLEDKERDVRWWAVRALGDIGDQAAIHPLITILTQEKDPYVQQIIVIVLRGMDENAVVEALHEQKVFFTYPEDTHPEDESRAVFVAPPTSLDTYITHDGLKVKLSLGSGRDEIHDK